MPARLEKAALALVALAFVALYTLFWPPIGTAMDESVYLNYADVLRQGKLYSDQAGVSTLMCFKLGAGEIIKFPPGMSLFIALVSFLGWGVAVGTNLFVHLGIFGCLIWLFRRLNVSPLWAVLYLLHPAAALYSRTLFSDPLGGLCLIGAICCLFQRSYIPAGLLLGFSMCVKTANLLALFFVLGGVLLDAREKKAAIKEAALICLGALPFILGAYLFQKVFQEGGWGRYGGKEQFGLKYLAQNLPVYLGSLLLIFPGMLLAPVFYRGERAWTIRLCCAGYLLLYGVFYWMDATESRVETLIVGMRFLLVVLPLFVLSYAVVLEGLFARRERLRTTLLALTSAALLGAALMIHQRHQARLAALAAPRALLAREIPPEKKLLCTEHAAKLLHPAWTGRRTYDLFDPDKTMEQNLELLRRRLKEARGEPVFVVLRARTPEAAAAFERPLWDAIRERFRVRKIADEAQGGLFVGEVLSEPQVALRVTTRRLFIPISK